MNVHAPRSAKPSPSAAPETFAALENVLAAQSQTRPKRLSQCARFLLDNPDAVALGTSATVARAAGVQPSTWVRFAQSLGFSGFSELQELCKTNLLDRGPSTGAAFDPTNTPALEGGAGTVSAFAAQGRDALASLAANIDPQEFERAVALLAEAETVHILGLRRSFPVAAYLFYALGKIGKRCAILDNLGGMLSDRTDTIGPRDVLLVITFHPYAPEVAEFAEAVSQAGGRVIAMTDSPLSPAAGMARTTLFVRDAMVSGFRSLSATMVLASSLAVATGLSNGALPED